jgi:hypothetical protein
MGLAGRQVVPGRGHGAEPADGPPRQDLTSANEVSLATEALAALKADACLLSIPIELRHGDPASAH